MGTESSARRSTSPSDTPNAPPVCSTSRTGFGRSCDCWSRARARVMSRRTAASSRFELSALRMRASMVVVVAGGAVSACAGAELTIANAAMTSSNARATGTRRDMSYLGSGSRFAGQKKDLASRGRKAGATTRAEAGGRANRTEQPSSDPLRTAENRSRARAPEWMLCHRRTGCGSSSRSSPRRAALLAVATGTAHPRSMRAIRSGKRGGHYPRHRFAGRLDRQRRGEATAPLQRGRPRGHESMLSSSGKSGSPQASETSHGWACIPLTQIANSKASTIHSLLPLTHFVELVR